MRTNKHSPWPLWAMVSIVVVFVGMVTYTVAEGNETITKGQTDSGYIRLKSTTQRDGTIKTTGYAPQGGVRLKTKTTATGTTTRGLVNGKYVRIKTTKKKTP